MLILDHKLLAQIQFQDVPKTLPRAAADLGFLEDYTDLNWPGMVRAGWVTVTSVRNPLVCTLENPNGLSLPLSFSRCLSCTALFLHVI